MLELSFHTWTCKLPNFVSCTFHTFFYTMNGKFLCWQNTIGLLYPCIKSAYIYSLEGINIILFNYFMVIVVILLTWDWLFFAGFGILHIMLVAGSIFSICVTISKWECSSHIGGNDTFTKYVLKSSLELWFLLLEKFWNCQSGHK